MVFEIKKEFGDHKIYTFDIKKHPFLEYFKKLYNTEDLNLLFNTSCDYNKYKDILNLGYLNDRDTDLHLLFYNHIKKNETFKILYCNFIKDIHKFFYDKDEMILYQSFPSIRIQYPESVCVPPHKDSDSLSNHPLGEKNFILPITDMKDTNSIFIESMPDKKDFKSIELKYGELFYFNGNTCTHYNEKNIENKIRISLDFRIIRKKEYFNYLDSNDLKKTNPRDIERRRSPTKMLFGQYYQLSKKNDKLENMLLWFKTNKFIFQHRPTFEIEEAEACYKYMLEDNFITEFKKTSELEMIISNYIGCKHTIMTTSGTIAIVLALMAFDFKQDDEVIVPNYTMIATINAVKMLKLKPVIVDVDPDTFTLNLNTIKKNITNKTKCVLHVSLNNRYKDIENIAKLCHDYNLIFLEDSAQSLGCRINGKSLGTFGEIGCFSLSTPKIISTGQGGFVVTNNDGLAEKMRMIKNFGRKESGKDDFITFGLNFKFTDLQAVIGIEQMKKMDYRVNRMREIYNIYYKYLKKYVKIIEPLSNEWIPWFVDIYVEDRDKLSQFLKKHNVSTRNVYGEINKSNIYYSDDEYPNSKYVCSKGIFLPSYVTLTDNEIIYICCLIHFFYNNVTNNLSFHLT